MKPYKLRRWRWNDGESSYYFFTCARPGRTGKEESKKAKVPDIVVNNWLSGLPGPMTAIVSLLGRKPNGMSEYSFYSFYGGYDKPDEQLGRKSFREWLDLHHSASPIQLLEHPTDDFQKISDDKLSAASETIADLLHQGHTVILVDSGGQQRTYQVCHYMGAIEDSSAH